MGKYLSGYLIYHYLYIENSQDKSSGDGTMASTYTRQYSNMGNYHSYKE